jgi:glutamate/tyrosine decarboxylase-like PLP-dependent enzyme
LLPQIKEEGLQGGRKLVLFVSDQAHYSFAKAAIQLGIGTRNVIKVATDEHARMLPAELDLAIVRHKEAGDTPFFVAATAGTTVNGAFDPIRDLREVTKRHGLWLHVDGSWGGPVVLSRKHRRLLDGVEESDSFTWDAHKLMGIPLICTAFLTAHQGALEASCALPTAGETDYLFHANDDAGYNLGRTSLQCGRRIDSLKLWLAWKHLGDAGFESRIDHLFELALHAESCVREHPDLTLMAPLQSLNVCFRYDPGPGREINQFNLDLREHLRTTGQSFINYATVDGQTAFRLVFPNPDLTLQDVDEIFQTITTAAEEMCRGSSREGGSRTARTVSSK